MNKWFLQVVESFLDWITKYQKESSLTHLQATPATSLNDMQHFDLMEENSVMKDDTHHHSVVMVTVKYAHWSEKIPINPESPIVTQDTYKET